MQTHSAMLEYASAALVFLSLSVLPSWANSCANPLSTPDALPTSAKYYGNHEFSLEIDNEIVKLKLGKNTIDQAYVSQDYDGDRIGITKITDNLFAAIGPTNSYFIPIMSATSKSAASLPQLKTIQNISLFYSHRCSFMNGAFDACLFKKPIISSSMNGLVTTGWVNGSTVDTIVYQRDGQIYRPRLPDGTQLYFTGDVDERTGRFVTVENVRYLFRNGKFRLCE